MFKNVLEKSGVIVSQSNLNMQIFSLIQENPQNIDPSPPKN